MACQSASQSTPVHFVHYAEGTHAYCAGGMLSYCTIISWWNFVPLPRCKNLFDRHLTDPQPEIIAVCAASKNGLAGYTFLNKILARFQHSYERAMPWAILEPNTNKCPRCRHCLYGIHRRHYFIYVLHAVRRCMLTTCLRMLGCSPLRVE